MRFRRDSIHTFNLKEHSNGLHKLPKEQKLLIRAKHGTMQATEIASLNTLGLRPADMAASLTKSAKRNKK